MRPFEDPEVECKFASFADDIRAPLLALRELIFETAADTPGVGRVEETLKWGEPAYLTPETKSGSTIRIAPNKIGGYAIFTHCQSSVLSDFLALFPGEFDVEGNRGLHFRAGDAPPLDALRPLIASALTYHQKTRRDRR